MKMQKQQKGEYGYPPYEAYFLISIAVFLLGYFSTGKKENLLTIVAVLGLLPSSKSLVSVVMYFKIPKFSEKVYQEVSRQEFPDTLFCCARQSSDWLHRVCCVRCCCV